MTTPSSGWRGWSALSSSQEIRCAVARNGRPRSAFSTGPAATATASRFSGRLTYLLVAGHGHGLFRSGARSPAASSLAAAPATPIVIPASLSSTRASTVSSRRSRGPGWYRRIGSARICTTRSSFAPGSQRSLGLTLAPDRTRPTSPPLRPARTGRGSGASAPRAQSKAPSAASGRHQRVSARLQRVALPNGVFPPTATIRARVPAARDACGSPHGLALPPV